MAKKKSAVKKKAAPKRSVKAVKTKSVARKSTAVKKTKKKLVVKKKAAAKKAVVVKAAGKKSVVKKKLVTKSVVRKKLVTTKKKALAKKKPVKKAIRKSTVTQAAPPAVIPEITSAVLPVSVEPVVTALACTWSLSEVEVTFSQSSYLTHFKYVRTNPADCHVKIEYQGTEFGGLDNEIPDPVDTGEATCSTEPQRWYARQTIPANRAIRIQLFENDNPMTLAIDTTVQSVP